MNGSLAAAKRGAQPKGQLQKSYAESRAGKVDTKKLDLDWLLKARLVVARCGEMDANKWWNTNGQLGSYGAKVLRRGFPRTHHFAQARSVFAVAAHRCAQVFDPPLCATFWYLSDAIEDEFDARWERWVDAAQEWAPFFEELAATKAFDVAGLLKQLGLVNEVDVANAAKLKTSAEGKAVRVQGPFQPDRSTLALMALAFTKSDKGSLAVPYVPLETI